MAQTQTQPLVIGGVTMPPLKAEGLTITKEKYGRQIPGVPLMVV